MLEVLISINVCLYLFLFDVLVLIIITYYLRMYDSSMLSLRIFFINW